MFMPMWHTEIALRGSALIVLGLQHGNRKGDRKSKKGSVVSFLDRACPGVTVVTTAQLALRQSLVSFKMASARATPAKQGALRGARAGRGVPGARA